MILRMAGFDHTTASLEEREQLALTKAEIGKMLSSASGRADVEGCVYVSTCGRGELYLFCEDSVDAADLLAEQMTAARKGDAAGSAAEKTAEFPRHLFRERTGSDAADHLFHTACGMCSQIYGEDQILSQLKQSLELAREAHAAGSVTDRLFLSAIAAAKKVKSTVRLTAVPVSVADRMLTLLESQTQVSGKNCLVIGNGEVGRLCAAKLMEAGAKVTVTVRNYRTREVVIPVGCHIVDYRERFRVISEADVIVSATASPHFTLPYPAFGEKNPLLDGRERFLFDLALPRDIAPEYADVPGIRLFGLDEVSGGISDGQADAARRAEEILRQEEENFFRWLDARKTSRQAVHVGELAAEDVAKRVRKRVKKVLEGENVLPAEDGKKKQIRPEKLYPAETRLDAEDTARQVEAIYSDAVKKVVDNLMYDLKDRLPEAQWKSFVGAMEQSAQARAGGGNAECGADACGCGSGTPALSCGGSVNPDSDPAPSGGEPKPGEPFAYFPLFLDTRKKTVLIYGAGHIALRRTKKLLEFSCGIHIVAPAAEEELIRLAGRYPDRIRYDEKKFSEEELTALLCGAAPEMNDKILFVVAATDEREINRRIGELCRVHGMPVSVADRKEESTCYFPGIAAGTMERDGTRIVAGISSEGADHARTAEAVRRIGQLLDGGDK